jgi:DNA topoisomerase-1
MNPNMANLVIVESPAKCQKIQGFLGSEYKVTASVGHIRQLKKSDYFDEATFTPKYDIIEDKKKVVSELKALIKGSSEVYLCADLDREGEAIAYSLASVLGLKDPKRIIFHEITKPALTKAVQSPTTINYNMVHAVLVDFQIIVSMFL